MSAAATYLTRGQTDDLREHVDAVSMGLQALAVLLVRERQALTERSTAEVLDGIANDKHAAVGNVAGLYAMLRDTLETLCGNAGDFSTAVTVLKGEHPDLAGRIDQLVALTRECQIANQENGALVNTRLRGTRGALESLQGASAYPPMSADTYGPGGTDRGGSTGDRLRVRA